jgi:hypothetical protein
MKPRSTSALRSSAFGFAQHIATHEARGNPDAVLEAEAELDRTLDELEIADGVRPVDYGICRLSDLGETPVDGARLAAIRERIASRENRSRRRRR